ncbi:hypothetical protein C0Q70_17006 [Pomacea canaliculata]|uniref:Uncharacterized protein n=1 Tax=Pomacea canaliculata TaxID=400727 RepID=A0A2T7NRG3_POMCA|nr:hypothetical protein C0Q70_17006 [Pomacea canaliculata]
MHERAWEKRNGEDSVRAPREQSPAVAIIVGPSVLVCLKFKCAERLAGLYWCKPALAGSGS